MYKGVKHKLLYNGILSWVDVTNYLLWDCLSLYHCHSQCITWLQHFYVTHFSIFCFVHFLGGQNCHFFNKKNYEILKYLFLYCKFDWFSFFFTISQNWKKEKKPCSILYYFHFFTTYIKTFSCLKFHKLFHKLYT